MHDGTSETSRTHVLPGELPGCRLGLADLDLSVRCFSNGLEPADGVKWRRNDGDSLIHRDDHLGL